MIENVTQIIRNFRDSRNWRQYHSTKNLSMAIAIEAGELMEHFQWLTTDESEKVDIDTKVKVAEELADVLIYCFNLADILNLDVEGIKTDKIIRNGEKYPIRRKNV